MVCVVDLEPIAFIVLGFAGGKLPSTSVDRNPAARIKKCLAAGEPVVAPVDVESVQAGDCGDAI